MTLTRWVLYIPCMYTLHPTERIKCTQIFGKKHMCMNWEMRKLHANTKTTSQRKWWFAHILWCSQWCAHCVHAQILKVIWMNMNGVETATTAQTKENKTKHKKQKKQHINGNFLTNLWNESQYDDGHAVRPTYTICVELIFILWPLNKTGVYFVQFHFAVAYKYISIDRYIYSMWREKRYFLLLVRAFFHFACFHFKFI